MDEQTACVLARLEDLYKQATVERSHNYTGAAILEAIAEIRRIADRELHLLRKIERLTMDRHSR